MSEMLITIRRISPYTCVGVYPDGSWYVQLGICAEMVTKARWTEYELDYAALVLRSVEAFDIALIPFGPGWSTEDFNDHDVEELLQDVNRLFTFEADG